MLLAFSVTEAELGTLYNGGYGSGSYTQPAPQGMNLILCSICVSLVQTGPYTFCPSRLTSRGEQNYAYTHPWPLFSPADLLLSPAHARPVGLQTFE